MYIYVHIYTYTYIYKYVCVCVYIYIYISPCIGMCVSVQLSRSVVSDSLRPHGLRHTRLPCPSPTLRACSDSCPLSQ